MKDQSNFSSFLKGYRDAAISYNIHELRSNVEKIDFLIGEVREILTSEYINRYSEHHRKQIVQIEKYEHYYDLGVLLTEIMSYVLTVRSINEDLSYKLKRIIHHYLCIAKILEHTTITVIAVNLAEQYKIIKP